ncbi:RagB/SusD family nutrient uptake outer membrane protein [Chitinophaga sp. Mgbs1]|uniref:RagB/SusD family nutrient uptake outer membrane protein n=1 Tax=Chitinophaga solisilvae TaxID=1233460 RepID=A0A433WCV5_9BACT|nr:RagB/SusD family nutrient uptake outer membrane protein [Chitinophaga solisilvae]
MKNTRLITSLIISGCMAVSCKKDFLQRNPQTEIIAADYFNSPQDLETYLNRLYDSQAGAPTNDINSDNVNSAGTELENLVHGNITQNNISGWDDWDQLRNANFMLDNVYRVKGDDILIRHYTGVARYFRARFYARKIAVYSDVPWYSTAMSNVDQTLYKGRDPRKAVADSVLADLEYAANNVLPADSAKTNGTRVSKYAVLALMSRFCLSEGTFRKYHPELNLQGTASAFLQKAAEASERIMNSGKYSVYTTGKGGEDYRALFVSPTLNGNREIIMWRESSPALGKGNDTHSVLGWTWSLSQSLVYTYLMKDGTPFTSQPDYDKKGFVATFADRDPRLAETVSFPGYSPNNNNIYYVAKPSLGGYDQLKYYPRDPAIRNSWGTNYTALPIYRYAEVLLNYAEAKAELDQLSQADLDKSVNLLRDRVLMPRLNMGTANGTPDPVLKSAYKEVNSANTGVILEIRRERRVELACEGLRQNDVNRWKAGNLLKEAPQGMYVPALGGIDMTGDGVADMAILPNENDSSSIMGLPADVRGRLARFYLVEKGKESNFYLTNGTNGHIAFGSDRTGRGFEEPKYYYRPIPRQQIVLNDNLKQIFGWDK